MIAFKTIRTPFVDTWADYRKTASFRTGGRWNHPNYPVMYLSTNPQNAMLELAKYVTSPKMGNDLYRLVAFEIKEPRLYTIEPKELPDDWFSQNQVPSTRDIGSGILDNDDYDGFMVPSVNINQKVCTHAVNSIRQASYANMIIHLERIGLDNISIKEVFEPIYSAGMFGSS